MGFKLHALSRRLRTASCAIALLFAVSVSQADFYVAHDGSDGNNGSEAKPFLTLERARDAVREVKRGGKLPNGGLTVWLRAGDFVRTNTLELTEADSGTAEAPITWRAYRDERVRLLGGRVLRGFTAVTDASVSNRLDEKARVHVLQMNLREMGMSDFGEMKSRGFGRAGMTAHCEVFFESKPMTLARWPNTGDWEKIAGFPETTGMGDDHGGKIGDLKNGFFYAGERPRRWKNTGDVWVHGYWAWDWANSYERVDELDLNRHFIRTAPPHGLYGFRTGQRFYFLNILEELDEPGEWFLDRDNGMLYFWPPTPRQDAKKIPEVILSLLAGPFVKMTDVSHVSFRGLVMEATRGNAVEIRNGTSDFVAGCLIRNIGDSGVVIEGGRSNGVRDCDILDTGDGGVSLSGGDRQTLSPSGHFVENTHFQRQGRWSKCYVPAVSLNGVGQRVSHNLIHDHPHAAILFSGNDHLIEFNEIHHIALETGDVGAIYTGRDYTFRGNRIRHNYIHETGGVGMGSMGVYMDDCVSGTEVFGNVFYKVHWAMFIGGGRDHRVENNIFVDCDPAVRADGRGLDTSPVWRGMVNDYMRKQLAAVPLNLYRERYPAMKSLDAYYGPPEGPAITGNDFKGVPPEGNLIAHNVAVGKWFDAGWHSKPEMFAVRDNFVTTDPKQIGTVAEGFRLPKDSPTWKLGFQPIAFEQIGLQSNETRQQLKSLAETTPSTIKAVARTDENSRIAHEQLLAKAKQSRIDVYFVGDSITRRWGATDSQYRPLLQNWTTNFFGWNAANFGWGADRIENILWRLENGELDGVNPKIIVVLAGINDVGNNPGGPDKASQIADGIKAIAENCRTKAPGATIVLTAIFPRNDNMVVIPVINEVNRRTATLRMERWFVLSISTEKSLTRTANFLRAWLIRTSCIPRSKPTKSGPTL